MDEEKTFMLMIRPETDNRALSMRREKGEFYNYPTDYRFMFYKVL